MFKKILIANRGEIARRINKVAQSMGVKTVAVYSDADDKLPYVREADEAIALGPAPAKDSYLDLSKLLDAAKKTSAEAIHPGYGFVSENAEFARQAAEAGIVFIGPPPAAMTRMKDKSEARKLVAAAGVPIVPGSEGLLTEAKAAEAVAEKIGYPVLVKAAGGGGGIGMTVATSAAELEKAFRASKERAQSAFGRDGVYLERYFANPRHIEVQILGDGKRTLHLFERECSIQRRHQKVVEESPAPLFMNDANAALKQKLYESALKASHAFGYANAGTVEFLYSDGEIYFIEMNARLQVEHPVTELTTGVDIIGWQLRIASGSSLDIEQSALRQTGHALQFRVYAEDPVKFFPSPGPLKVYRPPVGPDIRVDSGYEEGNTVTPYYDPMIAKLIVVGADRDKAIAKASEALESFVIEGIKHNLPLHQRIIRDAAFQKGELDTRFLLNHAKA